MNPLLTDWTTPFGIAPFERIEDAHFAPAFEAALKEARAEGSARQRAWILRDALDQTFASLG